MTEADNLFERTAKYRLIANELRWQILRGKYRQDRQIPTETQLVYEFAVSRGTVRQALDLLVQDWLRIYSKNAMRFWHLAANLAK